MSTSPECDNCGGWDDDATLYPVEVLTLHKFQGGKVGWAVSAAEWCGRCMSGAARQGSTVLAGRTTYGVNRPSYDQPGRVRFAS